MVGSQNLEVQLGSKHPQGNRHTWKRSQKEKEGVEKDIPVRMMRGKPHTTLTSFPSLLHRRGKKKEKENKVLEKGKSPQDSPGSYILLEGSGTQHAFHTILGQGTIHRKERGKG